MDENKLKQVFESFSPDERQKEKIIQNVLNGESNEIKRVFFRKKWTSVCVVIMTVIILSTFILARSGSLLSTNLENFKISNGEFIKNTNVSCTDSGFTITAESYFGDLDDIYVILSVSRDDGKIFKNCGDIGFNDFQLYYEGYEKLAMRGMIRFLDDYDTDDNKVKFVIYLGIQKDEWSEEDKNNAKNVVVEVSGLHNWPGICLGRIDNVNTGNWKLTIPLEELKDYGEDYSLNIPFEYNGRTVYVEGMHYSPFAVSVFIKSDDNYLKDSSYKNYLGDLSIKLNTKKGIVYPWTAGGDNAGTKLTLDFSFLEDVGALKPEDLEQIIIREKSEDGQVKEQVFDLQPFLNN